MFPLTLAQLPDALKAEGSPSLGFESVPHTPVTGAAIDSRAVRPGDLFFALPGDRTDGHAHAADALRRGAAAVVLARDTGDRPAVIVNDPAAALTRLGAWNRVRFGDGGPVIAVGGSHGKTTCREMLYATLSAFGTGGLKSRNNYNNALGVPLTLCELEPRHRFAVVEVGASRRGEIADLCGLVKPEFVVLTGVGSAHVGSFGGPVALRSAKRELLEAVPADCFAVVNGDEASARGLARDASCRVILAGTTEGCDVQVVRTSSPPDRLRFRYDGELFVVRTPAAHLLPLAACAVAVGRELGNSLRSCRAGLAAFRPPPGRWAATVAGGVTIIDDTYNAGPEAFLAAVSTLAEFPVAPGARRWLVAGGMRELGADAERLHAEVGAAIAAAGFDRVLFVGDRGGAVSDAAGLGERAKNADAAVAAVLAGVAAGDVVLVKGCRADRLERVVAGVLSGLRGRGEKCG